MTDSDNRPFAVVGATGQQGRAAIEGLLETDGPIRAIVRDPSSAKARALADRGVEVAEADQEDAAAMTEALRGVRALFLMTTFADSDGPDGEVRRGDIVADAASAAGVPRVVYSSVGGAERHSRIPHFESKRRIEQHLEGLLPASFVRPTFFMDNLAEQVDGWSSGEFVLRLPMSGDVPLQMVSVRDIGRVAARVLTDPDALGGADSVEIAGDEQTLDEVALRIGEHLHTTARFEQLPLDALGEDDDLKAMFRWFQQTPAYRADRATTVRLVPDVRDLSRWLANR